MDQKPSGLLKGSSPMFLLYVGCLFLEVLLLSSRQLLLENNADNQSIEARGMRCRHIYKVAHRRGRYQGIAPS